MCVSIKLLSAGLSREKLETLASPATPVSKLSRRDLAMAMSQVIACVNTAYHVCFLLSEAEWRHYCSRHNAVCS